MGELKTYNQWIIDEGRAVSKGQHAQFYAVAPDGSSRHALFDREQTEPVTRLDIDEYDIIPAADLPKQPTKRKGKHVLVTYKNGRMGIWVGSNEQARAILKHHKFRFMPRTGRWWKDMSRAQFENAKRTFEGEGFEVVDETVTEPDF